MFDLNDIRARAGRGKNSARGRKQLKIEIGARMIKAELRIGTDHPGVMDAAVIDRWGGNYGH